MRPEGDPQAPVTRPWRKILCAVDFSEPSRHAVDLAAQMAQRLGAELTLFHVHEPPRGDELPSSSAAIENGDKELQRNLARTKLYAQQFLDTPIQTRVVFGAAADEILAFAWEGRFDLVVTGTHGRSGVRRMVLGSVAETVVRRAPCPVLVARAAAVIPEDDELPIGQ